MNSKQRKSISEKLNLTMQRIYISPYLSQEEKEREIKKYDNKYCEFIEIHHHNN